MSTPIDVIDVFGGAADRGRAFGLCRRRQIHACLDAWLGSLRDASIANPHLHIERMLRETDFLAAIRRHTPDLLEELIGMARGAECSVDLLLAEQLMDEEWAYRASVVGSVAETEKCSSVAIHVRSGVTWLGQNMDLGGYTDGHQVVIRTSPHAHEPGQLIFTIGGMLVLMGVNACGVGVCVNALPQLPPARKGLPVAFMIRKLLQTRSLEEAVRTVRALPHATGQHYLIADHTGIRSFEASAAGVLEYHSPVPSRVVHTNHPLTQAQGTPYPPAAQINTETRLRSLTNRLMRGEPDLEAIKAALSSSDDPEYPVCRMANAQDKPNMITGMISFTTGSMISALRQDAPSIEAWVSNGPPRPHGYTPVTLPAQR